VGNNKAYPDYDFATNTILDKVQDPQGGCNTSPNNTGLQKLPPTNLPMNLVSVWSSLKSFRCWAQVAAVLWPGPVYYADNFPKAKSRFPKYYDGKLFFYEWARSWIKVASFDQDGNLEKIEPFFAGYGNSKTH
jgi:cytochrome c